MTQQHAVAWGALLLTAANVAAGQQRGPDTPGDSPPSSLASGPAAAAARGAESMERDGEEPEVIALPRSLARRSMQGSGSGGGSGGGGSSLGPRHHSLKRSGAATDASQQRLKGLLEQLLLAQAAAQAAGLCRDAAQRDAARRSAAAPSGSATPGQRTGSPEPSSTPQANCMRQPAEAPAPAQQPVEQQAEPPARAHRQTNQQQQDAVAAARRRERKQLRADVAGIQATVASALDRLAQLDGMLKQLAGLAGRSRTGGSGGGTSCSAARCAGARRGSGKLATPPASPQLAPDTPEAADGAGGALPAPTWARGGYRGPPPSKRLALLLARMPPQDAAGVLQARSFLSQF